MARVPVALALVLGILLHEIPAQAAGPDVGEARRRFVAAVKSSDQAVALAETSLDELIRKAGALAGGDQQRQIEAMQKLLKALRDFKVEKTRILARDLGTFERLALAGSDYARACQAFTVVVAVTIVAIAIVVTVVTFGSDLAAAQATIAAIAVELARLDASLTELMKVIEMLRAGEEDEARRLKGSSNDASRNIQKNIQKAADSLADIKAAVTSLRAASAATRDAQARLQALPKSAGPQLPARKQMELAPLPATFDGDLGGSFHVKLENGQATRPAGQAVLRGTIAITSTSNPNLKLTLEGDATLTAGGGGAWVSLGGRGTVRLSGLGPVLTIPNATLESRGVSALALLGDGIPVRGCTHSVEAGSLFAPSRVSFAGSLRCGPWSLSASTLKLEGSGVSGGGTLSAWSKSFTMAYAPSGDGLAVRGSLTGADTPWARVPGFEAEYRIEAPKLDLKLESPALSPRFGARKVSVRTTAKKPDGNPWSSASLTPETVVVPAPPADGIPVPFPVLPAPDDVERAARDACETGARRTLFGQALQHALDVCRSGHPSPPGVPTLPRTVSLKVGDVFR